MRYYLKTHAHAATAIAVTTLVTVTTSVTMFALDHLWACERGGKEINVLAAKTKVQVFAACRAETKKSFNSSRVP